ncbi:hypothetical protein EJ08DRAFT_682929 [Tothia fuscella]|uniref:Uncharacterized protein n=1 Tax=Tothia fuscella TaxID=1048955 RepID=A0A9P4NHG3_9PEZI|nr:hypothetical protein EJ08DRAFT_682929 [Tothia fuscella]
MHYTKSILIALLSLGALTFAAPIESTDLHNSPCGNDHTAAQKACVQCPPLLLPLLLLLPLPVTTPFPHHSTSSNQTNRYSECAKFNQEVKDKDRKEIHKDNQDISKEKAKIHKDNQGIAGDKKEIHKDNKDLNHDKNGVHKDDAKLAKEKAELNKDKKAHGN